MLADNITMSESIWNFFDKVKGGTGKLASCKLCDEIKNYESTVSNLKHHLTHRHRDEIGVDPDELLNLRYKCRDRFVTNNKKRSHRRTSDIWKFFEVTDNDTKKASCVLCKKTFSYKSSITNLKAHLKKKHLHQHDTLQQRSPGSGSAEDSSDEEALYLCLEDTDDEAAAAASRHFVLPAGGAARRGACGDAVPAAARDLRAHLYEKHRDLISEVVHKRSAPEPSPPPPAKRPRSPASPPRRARETRRPDTERFLAYVATLLEDLPRELSMKLQSNIVTMIVDAKLACDPLRWADEAEFEDRK